MDIEEIYLDLYKSACWMSPSQIMRDFEVTRYKANKVIKMFRDEGIVEYRIYKDSGCDGNCTNESRGYCECGPAQPPMGIWEFKNLDHHIIDR